MNVFEIVINKIGGQSAVARLLGVKQQNVQYHVKKGICPADWVLPLEKESGTPCSEIRPDLYPPERFSSKEAV